MYKNLLQMLNLCRGKRLQEARCRVILGEMYYGECLIDTWCWC